MKLNRRKLLISLGILTAAGVSTSFMLPTKAFGKVPSGDRLLRVRRSRNYAGEAFKNIEPTEVMRPDVPFTKLIKETFNRPKLGVPDFVLPSVSTDLRNLPDAEPVVVWFGHSCYMIKHKGFTILVDPVFSGSVSPVGILGKAFPGTNTYQHTDFGKIDMLILTHDHYDHLDYETVVRIHPQVKHIYTSLGVGSHLEYWGVPNEKVTELDWTDTAIAQPGIELTATPARHFSGRLFARGRTLWSSFVLKLNGYKIFVGGDSGYDVHFKELGKKYGPFDLAMLECGQYGENWPNIHMFPEETAQAAIDIKAKVLLPVHWGKFQLSTHVWDASIKRLVPAAEKLGLTITTPMIGQPITIGAAPVTHKWWEDKPVV
ncbi:MAG: MBL fold metallo-hydrolase [Bacteroidota bacterium]